MSHKSETVLFGFAPTPDPKDRFFSTSPTSLELAATLAINAMDRGDIAMNYVPEIFHPENFRGSETIRQLQENIRMYGVGVLCLSSTYDSHFVATQLFQAAREVNPDILTIYGGPHVDEVHEPRVEATMPQLGIFPRHRGRIDIAVAGDGEQALSQLLLDYANASGREELLAQLPNKRNEYGYLPGMAKISCQPLGATEPQIILTSGRPMDLDSLPIRRRDLTGGKHDHGFSCFTSAEGTLLKSTSTLTHRGCCGHCVFCSEALPYQHRSVDNILEEVNFLKEQGYEGIFFDDSTLHDHLDFWALVSRLKETGLQFGALTRFDKLQNPEEVRRLREAGFVYLYCAIEQAQDEALHGMGKNTSLQEIEQGIELLAQNDIKLGVSLLFGLPMETLQSVTATVDYAAKKCAEGKISYVSMSMLTYHARTAIVNGKEARNIREQLSFDGVHPHPPQWPWVAFEEGCGPHPAHVTEAYADKIATMANEKMGLWLVRNMGKATNR